jgi:uncharacterized Rmd1/YagE family protein
MDTTPGRLADTPAFHARAWCVGTRLDLRALERGDTIAVAPLTVHAGAQGYAMLFRYGAVVCINMHPLEEAAFLETLAPFISGPFDAPEHETLDIVIDPRQVERLDMHGALRLHTPSVERLQTVAHVLAKSIVLVHTEERVAEAFDRIERLTDTLQHGVRHPAPGRELLRHIGDVLLTQLQTVGRVEVTEKPEITWDDVELDRLYERLSVEYELRERDLALTRKLDLISRTVQTYLDLRQNRLSLRVEWYIVLLILVEIVILLYDLFIKS